MIYKLDLKLKWYPETKYWTVKMALTYLNRPLHWSQRRRTSFAGSMPLNWKKLNRHELNVNIIHFHPVSFEQLLHMWVLCRVITELSEPQARPLRLTWPRWPAAVTVHSWQLSGSTSEASSFLEAAMCHQGPTASHFKSANLLFFKLVTLTLLSSYTT